MLQEFGETCSLFGREVEFHVGCVLLEAVEKLFSRRSHDVVDFVHLVQLVVAWEQREERQHFEEDSARTPKVHFVAVVTVCE